MDILSHMVSGLAAGTVIAALSKRSFAGKTAIVAFGGLGGVLPDIDAISLWSGFDDSIGKLLHLPYPGKVIYSAKLWYSHHAFFHSIAAGLLFALIIGLLLFLSLNIGKKAQGIEIRESFRKQQRLLISFFCGYLMHLMGDIPTPSSSWGGVRMFWPAETYVGGTGDIWWWNNYDIFLILSVVFLLNMVVLTFTHFRKKTSFKQVLSVFILGLILSAIQIASRDDDYSYSGHTSRYNEMESASKKQQEKILGKKLYSLMENFDKALPFYF